MRDISVFDVKKKWNVSSIGIGELKEKVLDTDVTDIYCNPVLRAGDDLNLYFNDREHPIVTGSDMMLGSFVSLDAEHYNANKEELDDVISLLCRNTTASYFTIAAQFINDKTLKALSENKNIRHLVLGRLDDDYSLSREVYDLLKDTSIEAIDTRKVDEDLSDIFGEKIYYNNKKILISSYNYDALKEIKSLSITKPYTEEEIHYLKYVKNGIDIKIADFSDYDNIFKIVRRLKECGKEFHCVIEVQYLGTKEYKNQFNEYIFTHLDTLEFGVNVYVGHMDEYSIREYAKYEKRLIEMIQPAMNLSPLEKYLFAYNVTKKFKKYKENNENGKEARSLYQIMDNEYMVCVGYETLLKDLLNKLGLESDYYSSSVDIGLDNVPDDTYVLPDDVLVTKAHHARVMVNLVDPKYGIDGFYIADPTWDNVMDEDAYNFALMSGDEYNGLYRYNFISFTEVKEMFFVHSLDEFYQKANVWMRKEERTRSVAVEKDLAANFTLFHTRLDQLMASLASVDKESYDDINLVYSNIFRMKEFASNVDLFMARVERIVEKSTSEVLKSNYKELYAVYEETKKNIIIKKMIRKMAQHEFMRKMIDSLQFIDREAYASFEKERNELFKDTFEFDEEYVRDVMYRIGEYVVRKANKEISGEVLFEAIREMYRQVSNLTEEQLDEEMAHIIEYNKNRQEACFPTRYKILADGTRVPFINGTNKFDIEEKVLSA